MGRAVARPTELSHEDSRHRAVERRARARRRAEWVRALDDVRSFIPLVSPEFQRPEHLGELCIQFDRSMAEPVFCICEAPPRHWKSITLFHHVARVLCQDPSKRIAYATYSTDFAWQQSRLARRIAARAGIWTHEKQLKADDMGASLRLWETRQGGGFLAVGRGGSITGTGADVLIIDDPFKDREEAESPAIREKVWNWYTGTLFNRLEPDASVFILQQRWNMDDLVARLVEQLEKEPNAPPFVRITLPAVNDDDEPLCPQRYDRAALRQIEASIGPYHWWSQYMQRPRPRGREVFGPPTFYTRAPTDGLSLAYGLDLAFTASTQADRSVMLLLARADGVYYVRDVVIEQMKAPDWDLAVRRRLAMCWAPCVWYCAGTEKGSADFLKRPLTTEQGLRYPEVPLTVRTPRGDKFTRAQPCAAAWNAGLIQLPQNAPWVPDFVKVVGQFTGLAGYRDDEVDALVAAFDMLANPVAVGLTKIASYRAGITGVGSRDAVGYTPGWDDD